MNVVDDALSRKRTLSLLQMLTEWKIQFGIEYSNNQFACEILHGVRQNEVHYDLIYYKNRIFLVPIARLKKMILAVAHDAPVTGHPGFLKTYRKVRERFT